MTLFSRLALCLSLCLSLWGALSSSPAMAGDQRAMGKTDAPVLVEAYSSLTCSHCADFFTKVLPEIEKAYIETGKIRFVYHDFPIDGMGLKAGALAQCMPEATYFGFLKTLYANMASWRMAPKPEEILIRYAQMGGLTEEKAKACMEDTATLDALVAARMAAMEKHGIQATPTFILNKGQNKVVGAQSYADFAAAFDKALAQKKK